MTPLPSGICRFLKPSSLNPSEVQNPLKLRKLTTHTITINFFIIEAMSPTLVQLFKDYCYCAYVLRISRYSGFLWVVPTNTGIFLRSLKLCGESRT